MRNFHGTFVLFTGAQDGQTKRFVMWPFLTTMAARQGFSGPVVVQVSRQVFRNTIWHPSWNG
jgi:hypothetical protein